MKKKEKSSACPQCKHSMFMHNDEGCTVRTIEDDPCFCMSPRPVEAPEEKKAA